MLKILWVEDEFSEQKQVSWFGNRPVCVKTSFDEGEKAIKTCLAQFDLVVLDINLENSEVTEKVSELAKQFKISNQAFLQESGMNLFLNLLEHGFPKEQILFLTANADINLSRIDELREAYKQGNDDVFNEILENITNVLSEEMVRKCAELVEKEDIEGLCQYLEDHFYSLNPGNNPNTYNRFCEAYQRCRIEAPKAINKGLNEAKQHLNHWLESHESNNYLVLRRGIIEGCVFLKTQKEILRFDKYSADEKKPAFLDIDDYLEVLENFLPLCEPSNKTVVYKLFVRTLAHEWEESVKPKKIDDDQTTYAFSWIMKMTRNWMAHNSTAIFTNLTEQDVAYLFICNMRAIFDLGNEAKDYEKSLFLLFNKSEESEEFKASESNVKEKKIPLVKNYVSYFNETENNSIHVHNILHDLQNDKVKLKNKGDDFFVTGLYQSFWFLTSRNSNKNDKAKENLNNPNQVFISRYYSFDFFDYSQSEFLLKFSSHIYNRSFS